MLLYFQLRWLKTFLLKSNKSHHFHDTWNLKHANHATSSLLMFVKSTLQVPTLHLLRGCMDTTEEAKNVRSPSELCGKKMIPKWDLFDTPAISKTSKKIHHIYIYITYTYHLAKLIPFVPSGPDHFAELKGLAKRRNR